MKPLETKVIKIGGKEYSWKKSPRAYLKFQELSGHSISEFTGETTDSFYFLYSCLWGGGLRVSFDEFLDLTDNEDATDLITSFIIAASEPTPGEKKPKVR